MRSQAMQISHFLVTSHFFFPSAFQFILTECLTALRNIVKGNFCFPPRMNCQENRTITSSALLPILLFSVQQILQRNDSDKCITRKARELRGSGGARPFLVYEQGRLCFVLLGSKLTLNKGPQSLRCAFFLFCFSSLPTRTFDGLRDCQTLRWASVRTCITRGICAGQEGHIRSTGRRKSKLHELSGATFEFGRIDVILFRCGKCVHVVLQMETEHLR